MRWLDALTNRDVAGLAGVLFAGSTALTAVMLANGQLDAVVFVLGACVVLIVVLAVVAALRVLTRR